MNGTRKHLNNHSLEAAAQAAAQINAQLAAEGKIPPSHANTQPLHHDPAQKKGQSRKHKIGKKDLFAAEVEINDLPSRVRNLLTKGYIQEQIQWKSKAALCTKGRYVSPSDKGAVLGDRPLYICVQALEKQAVDEAVLQIQQFIAEHTNSSTGPAPSVPVQPGVPVTHRPPPPVAPIIRHKVYLSLDHAPESFKLVERVLGPGGDNVSYIQSETGVTVSLQGRGTGGQLLGNDEPLHLLLEHTDENAIQNARSLALSLVGTLAQDFVLWQREQQALQQQQQQQFVYTVAQPYYSGPTVTNGNYQSYPAVTAMVYNHQLNQTALPSEPQHLPQRDSSASKRSSRFDYQHPTGPGLATSCDSSPTKRPKLNHSSYPY